MYEEARKSLILGCEFGDVNNAQWTTQKASPWLGDGWREFIAACNKITRKNTKKVFLEGFR